MYAYRNSRFILLLCHSKKWLPSPYIQILDSPIFNFHVLSSGIILYISTSWNSRKSNHHLVNEQTNFKKAIGSFFKEMGSQKYDKIVLRNKETGTHLHNSRFPKSNSPSTVQHLDRLKAWTYTAGAIARCFIKDIYEMVQQTGCMS